MKPELGSILGEIMAAASLDEIWLLLVRYFRQYGFGAVAYVLFDKGRRDQVVAFLEDGYPPAVVQTFVERGYGRHAPLLRLTMTSGRPQLASHVLARNILSPEEQAHREAIKAAGLTEVLALPAYGPAGRSATVLLSEAHDRALYEEVDWSELQIVAQAAHSRAYVVVPRRKTGMHGLSQREVEILRWVAQGKSNSVIADILELAPGTVDTYLRRVFEKLDVSDRTSAAVRGVSMGLIRA